MKNSRNSFGRLCLCFITLLAAFATTSIFESLPLAVASTTPAKPTKVSFFGRISKKQTIDEETKDDKDESEVTEKKKSSWQFFYKKNEVATSDNKKGDESDEEEEEKKEKDAKQEADNTEESDDEKSEIDDTDGAAATDGDDKKDAEESEKDGDSDEEKEKDKESEEKGKAAAQSQDPMQMYRSAQLMQSPRFMSPGTIVYRTPSSPYPMQQQPPPGMPGQNQAMAAAAVVNLFAVATRLFFLKWVISKLAFEAESKSPVQHFMWECLNDKYIKDDEIWNRVLNRVPNSMKMSQRKWEQTVRKMKPDIFPQRNNPFKKKKRGNKKKDKDSEKQQLAVQNSTQVNIEATHETSKTVVVIDFSTMDVAEPDFLRFADVVTFLVGSNSPRKQMFGKDPEVVMTLLSPGGEVTSFAFAAAQVARLRDAGWKVTVCVDRIAASGGYMIASQATQILASPFAMVGSVGVITQSLNFYEILKKYGIKSLVLKAGDSKNPITQFGEVSDEDVKTTQLDLDETHQSFINLCRSRRPALDPAVCNGRILSGDMALERGMIDRILTSDEYILEKISEGDLVMKLHLVSGNSERNMIANALQILPHLSNKVKTFLCGDTNSLVGKLNASMDGNFASKVFQLVGIASMIRRALVRTGPF